MSKPTAFRDLDVKELRRSAIEDFAVAVSDRDSKDAVLAALTESGVKWADYVAQHPEVAPDKEESAKVVEEVVEEKPVKENVRVAEAPVMNQGDKFLIKMTRDNPLYEVRGHRFTTEHPYAIMSVEDAQYVLKHEDGFRQAFPDELAEYYS